jgi:hypothetical protein
MRGRPTLGKAQRHRRLSLPEDSSNGGAFIDAGKTVVVFTHGLVIRAPRFRQHGFGQVTGSEVAAFDSFRRSVGRLRLSTNAFVDHIPEELRTE